MGLTVCLFSFLSRLSLSDWFRFEVVMTTTCVNPAHRTTNHETVVDRGLMGLCGFAFFASFSDFGVFVAFCFFFFACWAYAMSCLESVEKSLTCYDIRLFFYWQWMDAWVSGILACMAC